MRVLNKVALVSGGGRGIGAAITKTLASEGAKVVIGDVLEDAGQKTAREITQSGGECIFVRLDVTKESDWATLVDKTVSHFGYINVLVNNAGITARGLVEEITEEDWSRVMEVNVKGCFLGTKACIPQMRAVGGGSIINISSGAAIAPQPNTSGAYSASKGAIRIFTKSTAIQYAVDNIRCNSVHPGPVETDMLKLDRQGDSELAEMKARVPLGRFGSPQDIGYGVLYLASDESSFVTGSELVIDGGRTAQ